ncbi:MAG: hypothetical protein HYZ14_17845 [Bacteroidetes bacterium]|nr:hypothetical protein [Bacteroidota bacterium]
MKTSKYRLYAFLVIFLVSLAAGIIHYWLRITLFPVWSAETPFWEFYLFLVPFSVLTIWFVSWRYSLDHTAAGRSYFITVFVKMFSSAIFLYPGVVVPSAFLRETVIQFMALFFILLFIETILLVRLLNRPLSENSKNDENQ